jgi:hypothetical protein
MTSPARISTMGSPSHCVRPQPDATTRVWPRGCVWHALRAPGSKVTLAHDTRAGGGGAFSGSIRTVPVNHSAGPLADAANLRVSVPWIGPFNSRNLQQRATRHARSGRIRHVPAKTTLEQSRDRRGLSWGACLLTTRAKPAKKRVQHDW